MDPAELAAAVSTTDQVKRYRIAPACMPLAAGYFLPTGTAALNESVVASRFGLAASLTDVLEGYVNTVRAQRIVNGLSLVEDLPGMSSGTSSMMNLSSRTHERLMLSLMWTLWNQSTPVRRLPAKNAQRHSRAVERS